MAKLGELTSPVSSGKPDPRTLVPTCNVAWEKYGSKVTAVITLRDVKTCKLGETQRIQLRPLTNLLCPVEAIKRQLAACRAINSPTLFSYGDRNGVVTHLTKDIVNRTLQVVWEQGGFQNLTGHSVRVGGASLRYAMEIKTQEICKISQWTSNCYELYMRVYSKEEKDESVDLMAKLDQLWETEGQGDSNYGLKPKDVGTN
ncbi:hypothetical protein PCANC_06361 [Puccinia coronata f. sp. avenae]|uniref:Tyr recombinase domain-containing protein n=1 Tax=Puccinia coronata f. sp. avenae TaxID=200324 RepID=A0A2N5T1M1_9BASI|nr:hypothetical protein PCANC_06361 [Puccinia coronata f. sp. avenae]PLW46357.1 hypothetical protein PCASD_05448 [Puccinia coronata f. sp. avenae]